MKEQEYDVTYWPKGRPTEKQTVVVRADGKENACIEAILSLPSGIEYVAKAKRKNYNWTGKGIVFHAKQRWHGMRVKDGD